MGFPGGSDGKESAGNVGDPASNPGSGRSPEDGNGNPLQDSCLENSMDRGSWRAIVHGVRKCQTRLSDSHTHTHTHTHTCVCSVVSHVQLFATPQTVAHQALLHGISQARILEWIAISFSRGSSGSKDQTCASCIDRWVLYH